MKYSFPEYVAMCSSIKLIWLQADFILDNPGQFSQTVCTAAEGLQKLMADAIKFPLDIATMIYEFRLAKQENAPAVKLMPEHFSKKAEDCIGTAVDSFMSAYGGDKEAFCRAAGYGQTWAEAECPEVAARFFRMCVDAMKETESDMIGLESPRGAELYRDGYSAIRYHDLSNLTVVFSSKDTADTFFRKYPVEASSIELWNDGRWTETES